jgi:hypothetical protein
MKTKLLIILLVCQTGNAIYSQTLIDIANLNVKLSYNQKQDYYFSFDKGDEIVFNLKMKQGRHFKLVEVASSDNVKFTEFKAKKIIDKKIKVRKKEVYRFRFFSSSLTNRVANVKIQRIVSPTSSVDFNTGWKYKIIRDTIYTPYRKDSLIGYKTISYNETVRELKSTEIEEIMLFEKSQKVHSRTNVNGTRGFLKVVLPQIQNTEFKKEKILSWVYWIGVGQEGQKAYEKSLKSISKLVGKVASNYYQTPLAAYAVGAIAELIIPKTGEDVAYYFIPNYENAVKFYNKQNFLQFDDGKGRAAYGRNDRRLSGVFYIGLRNDNFKDGIEVEVKVLVLKEVKTYEDVFYERERKEPQYVTLNKTKMEIKERKLIIPIE